jgi:hypothetical protein
MIGEAYVRGKTHDEVIKNLIVAVKNLTDVAELMSKRLKDLEAWTECP